MDALNDLSLEESIIELSNDEEEAAVTSKPQHPLQSQLTEEAYIDTGRYVSKILDNIVFYQIPLDLIPSVSIIMI